MAKSKLLHVAFGLGILVTVPAFAQTQGPEAGMKSPNNTNNPEAAQPQTGAMAPANSGANSESMVSGHNGAAPVHHMAQRHTGMMREKTDTSQDAAVDRLNDESYQAAEKGQMFSAAGSPAMTNSSGTSTSGTSTASPAPSGAMTNPTK